MLSKSALAEKYQRAEDFWKWENTIFPNLTKDMYFGNDFTRTGHKTIDGGETEIWSTMWGTGEIYKDKIISADFSFNTKVTVYICADRLRIVDIRHSGKNDVWVYDNTPNRKYGRFEHDLEEEKIQKIINTKIPNCKYWDMVQKRIKELYEVKI